jgi:hypothetical protein
MKDRAAEWVAFRQKIGRIRAPNGGWDGKECDGPFAKLTYL